MYQTSIFSQVTAVVTFMALGWVVVVAAMVLLGREFRTGIHKAGFIAAPVTGLLIAMFLWGNVSRSDARALGFDDYFDMKVAYQAGVGSAKAWKARKADDAAKASATEQQAQLADITAKLVGLETIESVALLKDGLKDPWSAEVKVQGHILTNDGVVLICGMVNAKNTWGAYTGFKRFLASKQKGVALIDPETQGGQFNEIWSTCS